MYRITANGQLFCSSKAEPTAIINPVITLEMNKAGTFSFVVPVNHPYYSLIERKSTLIDVYRDEDTEPLFEGICVSVEVDFYKQKTIVCEGELTFLNDSTLRPHHYQGLTSRQLLEAYIAEHNSLVEEMKRFTVGQVTAHDSNDYITCFTNYQSTMTEIKEDLVDDIGGFLRCRHEQGVRYVDYLADAPRTNNQVIRLGENLLDLTQSLNTDDLATVIIPLGYTIETQSIEGLDERLTIKNAGVDSMHPQGKDYVYSAQAVETFGWIEKVVIWDDVTQPYELLSKAEKYLQETQWENLIITAKAIDLGLTSAEFEKFKLYDSIRVKSDPHGLDRYFTLSKITYNLNNPENDTITLGIEESKKTLSAKTASTNANIIKRIEQMPTSNAVQAAIDNATALITGAEGGYVVYGFNAQGQPTELKIQDAIENPTKIWRWNQNGLGYSSDGGQTYGLAMTKDGSIVADFITSGVMTANRVRGGELLVGGSGVAANGSITVKDSSNQTIATLDKNGLDVKKGSIRGANLNVGGNGNTDGYIYVRDSVGNVIASLDRNGLYIYDTQGNTMARLNQNGLYCSQGSLNGVSIYQESSFGGNTVGYAGLSNGILYGGLKRNGVTENTGRLSFVDGYDGTPYVQLRSDHNFVLNAERVIVGTNSGRLWYTENNNHTFTLPAWFKSDGTIGGGYTGVTFINGLLPSLGG